MSNNAITLLKVLLHGDIYIDEIEKYTNLDNATVDRNIQVLNEYLKDKGINPIKKIDNIYSIKMVDETYSAIFSKLDILSSKERQDIYCIRLLMDGHINLEKERKKIGVSRTTAIKDFKKVKNFLETKKIVLESKNSKGIFLKNGENPEIWNVLCEKFMKLFIDRDFLSKQRKELLDEINIFEEKKYIALYSELSKIFKLKKSIFSFYSIYSMGIIEKIKGKLNFSSKNTHHCCEFQEILNTIDELPNASEFSKDLKIFIVNTVLKSKYFLLLDKDLKKGFKSFIAKLKEIFNLTNQEKEKLQRKILVCYVMGYLDKRYGVIWVKKRPESIISREFDRVIENILKDLKIDMIYSDILRLADCITKFFMNEEYVEGFKVLSISRNIDSEYNKRVIESIKVFYPKITFITESFLEFRFRDKDEIEQYDLMISDVESYSAKKLRRLNSLSLKEIQRCLIEYVLDKRLKSIK